MQTEHAVLKVRSAELALKCSMQALEKVMKVDLENKGSGVTKLVSRYTDELRSKSLQLNEKMSILKRCVSFRSWTQASEDMEASFKDSYRA